MQKFLEFIETLILNFFIIKLYKILTKRFEHMN